MRLYITPKEAKELKNILKGYVFDTFPLDIEFANMIIKRIELCEKLKKQGKKATK